MLDGLSTFRGKRKCTPAVVAAQKYTQGLSVKTARALRNKHLGKLSRRQRPNKDRRLSPRRLLNRPCCGHVRHLRLRMIPHGLLRIWHLQMVSEATVHEYFKGSSPATPWAVCRVMAWLAQVCQISETQIYHRSRQEQNSEQTDTQSSHTWCLKVGDDSFC